MTSDSVSESALALASTLLEPTAGVINVVVFFLAEADADAPNMLAFFFGERSQTGCSSSSNERML